MWHRDIPLERDAGAVRCSCMRVWGGVGVGPVLSAFGLHSKPDGLLEVAAEKAHSILAAILSRDLAYKNHAMTRSRADELAREFVSAQEPGAKFFSNADWSQYFDRPIPSSFGWNNLTESTFDAGLLAIGERFASCVWVEDED
jgi:hypothetical protein